MTVTKNSMLRVAIFSFIILLLNECWFVWLEQQRKRINEARTTYISALNQTKAQLANHLFELIHDSVFVSNLMGQQSYSVSRSLSGELQPGTLDFVIVFDGSCRFIYKTGTFTLPDTLCNKSSVDRWQWFSLENKPMVFLLKEKTEAEKTFYIGAGRFLNTTWAKSFPLLMSQASRVGLKWGAFKSKPVCRGFEFCSELDSRVWSDGEDREKHAVASLVAVSSLYPFLRPWLNSPTPLANPWEFPLLLTIILLLAFEAYRVRKLERELTMDQQFFLRWCRGPSDERISTPALPFLEKAQDHILSFVRRSTDQTWDLAKQIGDLEQKFTQVQTKLKESQRKTSEYLPYLLLSNHIKVSYPAVDQVIGNFMEGAVDLASILDKGLIATNKKLSTVVRVWQEGIAVKGERLFFRSLYEKEGDNDGESLLRSELTRIFALIQQISDLANYTASLARKIHSQENELGTILATWSQLAGRIGEPDPSFAKIGESAAALLQVERKKKVTFISKMPEHLSLALPQTVALGVFFLLFKAMQMGLQQEEGTLIFRLHKRHRGGQSILALFVTNTQGKILICHPREDLLVQAGELLEPWDLRCEDILHPEGGAYVILRGSILFAMDTAEPVHASEGEIEAV